METKKEQKVKNEAKTQKTKLIIEFSLLGLIIVFFVIALIIQGVAPDSSFGKWSKEIWDLSKVGEGFSTQKNVIVQCIVKIVIIYAICKIVRFILAIQSKKSAKKKTVITLFDGLIKYGCAIAIIILVLQACGVDTSALLASVGVLTLIVGLGAQSLIADIIAGMFVIFEDEYEVGEIISVDDFRGTVIEIGIRSTKILDAAGNIKIINNSNISDIVNLSRELSLASVECEFPYDVPIEYVEKLFNENLAHMKETIPGIVEGPFYKGVTSYYDSNIAVKLVAKCKEEDKYQIQRDLLREYRKILVEHNIDLSYTQIVVNQAAPSEIKISKKDKQKSEEFVEEQRELSVGLEEQESK